MRKTGLDRAGKSATSQERDESLALSRRRNRKGKANQESFSAQALRLVEKSWLWRRTIHRLATGCIGS
jgi:hypothetical protein